MNKPYDVGFICGRFQTFHKGHEKLVETGLMLCDRLLIFIGSSQEDGTERNPFNITTREKMLKEIRLCVQYQTMKVYLTAIFR